MPEYDVPQQQVMNTDFGLPVQNAGMSSDLLRWQMNNADTVEEIEHWLKGEEWNHQEGKWERRRQMLVNEQGIAALMYVIKTYVDDKNAILGNLSDDHVNTITLNCAEDVIDLLETNWNVYGVRKEHLSMIKNSIKKKVLLVNRRGFNEGERRFLRTTERRTEQVLHRGNGFDEQPEQGRKRSFWSYLRN